ncbi:hypothetical protein LTR95_000958 [Oleoguttula sp. CCFEE 5521]
MTANPPAPREDDLLLHRVPKMILAAKKDTFGHMDLLRILQMVGIAFKIVVCSRCHTEDKTQFPTQPGRVVFYMKRMLSRSKIENMMPYVNLTRLTINPDLGTLASGITARTMYNTPSNISTANLALNMISFKTADEDGDEPFDLIAHPYVDLDMILSSS